MYIGFRVKCTLLLYDFNEDLNFLDRFSENNQISNFIKICPVSVELFHMDEQTERYEEAYSPLFAVLRNGSKN